MNDLFAMLDDLSNLKRLSHDLIEQEREIWNFFSLSNDLYCVANADGYFKRLNPAWERILGWEEEELLGRPWLDFVHIEDVPKTIAAAKNMFTGDLSGFENRYKTKDGRWLWLQWTCVQWDENGNTFGVARDVSRFKRVRELVRVAYEETQNKALLEALKILE